VTACDDGALQSLINSTERIVNSVVSLSNRAIADSPLAGPNERLQSEIRQARAIGQLTVLTTSAKVKKWLATEAPAPTAATPRENNTPARPDVDAPSCIGDYVNLSASQIVPLLAGLTSEERAQVFAYESATRQRKTILAALAKTV
jgi:hypothetical protein